MRLKNQPGGLHDEAVENLRCGLYDHDFARDLVRAVGPTERKRFADHGWAYGDPSAYYGTDPFEVMCYQAKVVVKTLFGEHCSCALHVCWEGNEYGEGLLWSLQDPDGHPVEEEDNASLCLDEESSVLVAEIGGDPETLWRIRGFLRAGKIDHLHFNPYTEPGKGYDRSTHLLLLYDMELYPERDTIHHELFALLIRAWKEIYGRERS